MFVALVSGQSAPTPAAAQAAPRPQSTAQQTPAVKPAAPAVAPDLVNPRPVMDQYCVTCHNARLKTADLMLDQVDLAKLGDRAELGEKIVRKLRAGQMPPPGARRPDVATLESMIQWMENELDRAAVMHLPAPGR